MNEALKDRKCAISCSIAGGGGGLSGVHGHRHAVQSYILRELYQTGYSNTTSGGRSIYDSNGDDAPQLAGYFAPIGHRKKGGGHLLMCACQPCAAAELTSPITFQCDGCITAGERRENASPSRRFPGKPSFEHRRQWQARSAGNSGSEQWAGGLQSRRQCWRLRQKRRQEARCAALTRPAGAATMPHHAFRQQTPRARVSPALPSAVVAGAGARRERTGAGRGRALSTSADRRAAKRRRDRAAPRTREAAHERSCG